MCRPRRDGCGTDKASQLDGGPRHTALAMTSPPSDWFGALVHFALRLLAIALVLYMTARLIEAVLPVLIGIGAVGVIGFAGWSIYQFRRSRW